MQADILFLFGQAIRGLRQEKTISQEAFADMCGLHRTYISDVELGKRNVSLKKKEKMANALDITLPKLFERVVSNAGI